MQTKFPKEYLREESGEVFDPLTPKYSFDTHGRLVLPFTPYQKIILSTLPGSTDVKQGTEDETGQGNTDPGALKSGSLNTGVKITIGGTTVLDAATGIAIGSDPTQTGWYIYDAGLFGRVSGNLRFGFWLQADDPYGIGDVLIGDITTNYIFWDQSTGILTITGGVITGYIQVGGAAADVNAGVTKIQPGLIIVSGSTEFTAGYDPSTKLPTADAGDMAYEDLVQAAKLGTTIIQGGYIITSLLTADNIIAGTLTGRTVQSSSGLSKVVLNATNDSIDFYYAGVIIGSLISDNQGIYTDGRLGATGGFSTGSDITIGGYVKSTLKPYIENTYDLGTLSRYWNNIYVNYIRLPSAGRILVSSTFILDFSETKLNCGVPFGFKVRSGTPGTAGPTWLGYMYYDTAQDDIVFCAYQSGTGHFHWYKITATEI